jgi:hypothetical protein
MRYHVSDKRTVKLTPKHECSNIGCERRHVNVNTDIELLRDYLDIKREYLARIRELVDPAATD